MKLAGVVLLHCSAHIPSKLLFYSSFLWPLNPPAPMEAQA